MQCRCEYEQRLADRRQTDEGLRRQEELAINFRLAVAAVGLLTAGAVWGGWGAPWQILLLPVGGFVAAVIYHESLKYRLDEARRAIEYYERCLQRLDSQWAGVGPTGEEFIDPLHPSSSDLDLFGHGSLFQLLNSPVTPVGAKTLAAWLAPAANEALPAKSTVVDRQHAIRRLRDQLDLREQLAIIGPTKQSHQDAVQLQQWLAVPGGLGARWIQVTGVLLGIAGTLAVVNLLVAAAGGAQTSSGALTLLLLVVGVQRVFSHQIRSRLLALKQHSEQAVEELKRIVRVLAALERVPEDDPTIKRLRGVLVEQGDPASEKIHRLIRLVSQYDNLRRNLLMAPLAYVTMIGLYYACAIDRWRTTQAPQVASWFRAAGELEALLAFSQLHFENPGYSFPQMQEQGPLFRSSGLSHPLLPHDAAVANDVLLDEACRLLLVSGSNMSGKSTLMRSVGINTVLAWAGAPVFARELRLSRLRVAGAMRVQDSLQSGTSRFYAELKRIQLVVQLAEEKAEADQVVLFLLDEILHGTNSHDRLVGARAVIKRLLESGSMGLVTTHDLALSQIAKEPLTPAKNVHFRDESVNGEMTFDYKMRPGVVPKSNAITLMRLLGFDV